METASLTAQVRDKATKAKVIRRQGMIPAEYYGHGVENLSLQMDYQTFRKLYRTAGENTIIDLDVEGKGQKKVLVQRVDYHPSRDEFLYVEFINVRMDEEVTAHVPIKLEGQSPAVKELGGVLTQSLDEVEIRCLPADLIHEVVLSIEPLVDFHSALHVSDLEFPSTVTCLTDAEQTIATVQAPKEEEPEDGVSEEAAVDGVEVTSEKKEENAG